MSVYHFVKVVPGWQAVCTDCEYRGEVTTWETAELDAIRHEQHSAEVPS